MTSIVILIAGLSVTLADDVKSDSRLEERWRREYPSAAAEWEEAARHVWAEGGTSYRYMHGGLLVDKFLQVAASGDKKLSVRDQRSLVSGKSPTLRPGRWGPSFNAKRMNTGSRLRKPSARRISSLRIIGLAKAVMKTNLFECSLYDIREARRFSMGRRFCSECVSRRSC